MLSSLQQIILKCPLKSHLFHLSWPVPCLFLESVGVETTAMPGSFRIETSLLVAHTWCFSFCALGFEAWLGASLNIHINFLVMSFGFNSPGCFAFFYLLWASISWHSSYFASVFLWTFSSLATIVVGMICFSSLEIEVLSRQCSSAAWGPRSSQTDCFGPCGLYPCLVIFCEALTFTCLMVILNWDPVH